MKKIYVIIGVVVSIVFALTMTFITSQDSENSLDALAQNDNLQILAQEVTGSSDQFYTVTALYDKGKLVGYFTDGKVIDQLFDQVYQERFIERFPNTKIGLSPDSYIIELQTYNIYQDIDEQLINYINDNELFAVEATKVTFSNDVYCYIKDIEDFEKAKELYLLNFIDSEDYQRIKEGIEAPVLTTVGSQPVALMVNESASIGTSYSSPNRVLQSVEEIVEFLSFGYSPSRENYTVKKYDTIPGIAYRNEISIDNLMTINSDVLVSEDQLLSEGMVLNVAKFDSPIRVVVQEQSIEEEIIIASDPEIIVNNQLPLDYRNVIVERKNGRQLTEYLITSVNGVVYDVEEVKTTVIEQAINMVVEVGSVNTGELEGIFDWPIDPPRISCGWFCYPDHRALDFVPNPGNSYDWPIMAIGDGVITRNSYWGNYGWCVDIKHTNGYTSRYAHMNTQSKTKVGQTVVKGEVIGGIGNTGLSYGAHLHLEILKGNVKYNPCLFFGC